MFLYKEPDNFKEIPSKNLNGEIIIGSTVKQSNDSFPDDIDIDYGNDNLVKWEEMMHNGLSPLNEIVLHFHEQIPIFDPHFLNTISFFLNFFPEEGVKIIDYILYGPLQNITIFKWDYIYQILLKNLPYTIKLIAHSLFIQETENLHHRAIFLEIGGLSFLYPYANDIAYQNSLSLILKFLSSYKLIEDKFNQPFAQKKQSIIFLGNDHKTDLAVASSPSSSFEDEFENDIESNYESLFLQFCESLLLSDDSSVRKNTFEALDSLTENDSLSCDFISRIVISHIDKVRNIEELTFALKILSNSLKSTLSPFISQLKIIITRFIETTDNKFIDAFCAFIENLIQREDSEYIWKLGVTDKILSILTTDSPFYYKKNALSILIKIANACDLSTFTEIISSQLLTCLIDFLDMDNEVINIGILNIIIKLINNWQNMIDSSNCLSIIYTETDLFIDLSNSDNDVIRNLSSYILSFIDAHVQNDTI